ncbi:alpha/beta family hydrolase [Yunchengibacter salinarum]|uniref:alpha/beta family hydrolase n=1 Tax=Yunchengibacter salinarum TaxID=3133399 RepID=UPI0035B60D08
MPTSPPLFWSGRPGHAVIVLAHGAGAGPASPAMLDLANALTMAGFRVARFAFHYMERAEQEGRRRPPDRQPALLARFGAALAAARGESPTGTPMLLAGKSMGGRMASLLLAGAAGPVSDMVGPDVMGGVCFGYPFHPPGKPDRLRTGHFADLARPLLIHHGTRDPFGKPDLITRLPLPDAVSLNWLDGGDHDLTPPKRSGHDRAHMAGLAAAATRRWLDSL